VSVGYRRVGGLGLNALVLPTRLFMCGLALWPDRTVAYRITQGSCVSFICPYGLYSWPIQVVKAAASPGGFASWVSSAIWS
jgi:hypothetical protein